jgi:hypothetical protein
LSRTNSAFIQFSQRDYSILSTTVEYSTENVGAPINFEVGAPGPGPITGPGPGPITGPGPGPITGPIPGPGPITGSIPGPGPITGPGPGPITGPITGPVPGPGPGPITGPIPGPGPIPTYRRIYIFLYICGTDLLQSMHPQLIEESFYCKNPITTYSDATNDDIHPVIFDKSVNWRTNELR